MKVGDLVKMPSRSVYPNMWWSDQIGIIDIVEPKDSGNVRYRVFIPGKGTARFSDVNFVEVVSESR